MKAPANPLLDRSCWSTLDPAPRRVAVIGAGTIGPDIGYYLKSALPGLRLTLLDLRQEAVDAALARLHGYADKAVARGKLKADEARAVMEGIGGGTDYALLDGCDWVIEAATEDLALKRRIFAAVEARVSRDAIITSNTSSLPAGRLFAELKHPERATVTHFFAPAWRNPIVEVIDWPRADRRLLGTLRRLFALTGKVPLTTADVPCFMLDRIFDNWCNDAALLLPQASAAQIDAVAEAFVHAGPFFVLNLAHGNPIIVETNTLQADEEGEHYRPAAIFGSVERWLTGPPGAPPPGSRAIGDAGAAAVRDRLLGVLWSQAGDILDRGIGDAADLDLGCRLALGFKHGPIELAEQAGVDEVARVLKRFGRERPGMPGTTRPLAGRADLAGGMRHTVVDRVGDIIVITLRRPEALNALHDAMTDEILGTIGRHEHDPAVLGFVITGYGTKAFCTGADIGRFPALLGDAAAAAQYARDCSRLLVHLDRCIKPVVAAVQGMALGGGFELVMRCHGIVAERRAWFQMPEITLGIVPGIGALAVPQRRWPAAAPVLQRMLLHAERLPAMQAHELGIVDALADDPASLFECAFERVRALAAAGGARRHVRDEPVALPPLDGAAAAETSRGAAGGGKVFSPTVAGLVERAVRDAARAPSWDAALEVGYHAFGQAACTAAAREGIEAFVQRRAPDFSRTG
ncbi:MAG: enoyl-CoA hydratase/isomerase family protein [Rubrivivax sp.]|nr:enoyl-CoA hydratase/isomerase family protein [Rubrivivax sp.]